MDNEYGKLYQENADFKDYADRYCAKHRIEPPEAITHIIVQEYGKCAQENAKKEGK